MFAQKFKALGRGIAKIIPLREDPRIIAILNNPKCCRGRCRGFFALDTLLRAVLAFNTNPAVIR
jgi:hypothetical protein